MEAWVRLDDVMPTIEYLEKQSRKRAKPRLSNIDHDLAERVYDIAREIEPWLKQLAEREENET